MTLRQHRSHTASLDCVIKTVSKNLDFNLLVRFNIWTLQATLNNYKHLLIQQPIQLNLTPN